MDNALRHYDRDLSNAMERHFNPAIPNLEMVKRGVLVCPSCEHLERGTVERPCPTCTRSAEDGLLALGPKEGK